MVGGEAVSFYHRLWPMLISVSYGRRGDRVVVSSSPTFAIIGVGATPIPAVLRSPPLDAEGERNGRVVGGTQQSTYFVSPVIM